MSREVCGICWCPYDEDTGECACAPQSPPQRNPVEWDGRCMLGHCNSPAGCENSGECRAVERAHGIGGEE